MSAEGILRFLGACARWPERAPFAGLSCRPTTTPTRRVSARRQRGPHRQAATPRQRWRLWVMGGSGRSDSLARVKRPDPAPEAGAVTGEAGFVRSTRTGPYFPPVIRNTWASRAAEKRNKGVSRLSIVGLTARRGRGLSRMVRRGVGSWRAASVGEHADALPIMTKDR